jgi:hypothetical protein
MKTVVELPDGWTAVPDQQPACWQSPDGVAWIEVDPLGPLPEDRKGWGERVLRRGVPAGASLEQVGLQNGTTQLGWPVTLVATVVKDAGGQVGEHRLSGFYEFLLYGGAVVFRARDAETFARLRPQMLERVLGQARPDLRGPEVARIDEIYDIAPTP